jgi:hypothetical protein
MSNAIEVTLYHHLTQRDALQPIADMVGRPRITGFNASMTASGI